MLEVIPQCERIRGLEGDGIVREVSEYSSNRAQVKFSGDGAVVVEGESGVEVIVL